MPYFLIPTIPKSNLLLTFILIRNSKNYPFCFYPKWQIVAENEIIPLNGSTMITINTHFHCRGTTLKGFQMTQSLPFLLSFTQDISTSRYFNVEPISFLTRESIGVNKKTNRILSYTLNIDFKLLLVLGHLGSLVFQWTPTWDKWLKRSLMFDSITPGN